GVAVREVHPEPVLQGAAVADAEPGQGELDDQQQRQQQHPDPQDLGEDGVHAGTSLPARTRGARVASTARLARRATAACTARMPRPLSAWRAMPTPPPAPSSPKP